MTLINLTPHDVIILGNGGEQLLAVAPSGVVARLPKEERAAPDVVEGGLRLPSKSVRFLSRVDGLPAPRPSTTFIVSHLAAQQQPDRADLVFPYGAVRDDEGRVVGCRFLGRIDHLLIDADTGTDR